MVNGRIFKILLSLTNVISNFFHYKAQFVLFNGIHGFKTTPRTLPRVSR